MATTARLSLMWVWAILAWAVIIVSLLLTSPTVVGPYGVTLWFLILLSALATSLCLLLYVVKGALKIEQVKALRLQIAWRQGGLIAIYLTVLLAMQSLKQLALRDVVLLAAIVVCTELFIRFRTGVSHE